MAGFWLVFTALAVLTLLAYFAGVFLIWMPRECAVLCEVVAASGNIPSFLPRSVRGVVVGMRFLGLVCLGFALFSVNAVLTSGWTRLLYSKPTMSGNPYWVIFPGFLALFAGYTLAAEGAPRVNQLLDYWVDHPLVPHKMLPALPWALRLAGIALVLFGAGVFWTLLNFAAL